MTTNDPISRAPGAVDATRDDHTDDAIARMLDKPSDAMRVIQAMADHMSTEGNCCFCEGGWDWDHAHHAPDCPTEIARQLLARN